MDGVLKGWTESYRRRQSLKGVGRVLKEWMES